MSTFWVRGKQRETVRVILGQGETGRSIVREGGEEGKAEEGTDHLTPSMSSQR